MNLKDQAQIGVQEVIKESNLRKITLITRVIEILFINILTITILWVYTPYNVLWKIIITILDLIMAYDIFKTYITVKWILA